MTLPLLFLLTITQTPGDPRTATATSTTTREPLTTPPAGPAPETPACVPACERGDRCLATTRGSECFTRRTRRSRRAEPSRADSEAFFGRSGQVAVGGATSATLAGTITDPSSSALYLSLDLRYFVIENFALLGLMGIQYEDDENSSAQTSATFGGGFGGNLGISPTLSLLGEVALLYRTVGGDETFFRSFSVTSIRFEVNLVVAPAEHVYVGIGPFLTRTLSIDSEGTRFPNTTAIGMAFSLGVMF